MHAILFGENYFVKVSGCVLRSGEAKVDAMLWCCEDYKLRRAKPCVGSEILSTVTSRKGRQQPELLTSGHLGSNMGNKESVSGFSSKVCSGQPNSHLPALPSKVYSTTHGLISWKHKLAHKIRGTFYIQAVIFCLRDPFASRMRCLWFIPLSCVALRGCHSLQDH